MSNHEPVSLSRIHEAFSATIEDLNHLTDLNDEDRKERERVVRLLENLAGLLELAIPCRSFFPMWDRSP